jgi:hypothetical protein
MKDEAKKQKQKQKKQVDRLLCLIFYELIACFV